MHIPRRLPTLLLVLAAGLALAGRPPDPAVAQGGDRLPVLAAEGDGSKPEVLGISKVEVDVRVVGWLAETKMTLVFSNPHERALAGDLYFPLPEGATVSGYALDVNGSLIDGVVVEKEKARQVFEKEQRKGVDPGLVEWAQGNVFKTRVFPIPAHGTRTVAVSYVSDITAGPEGAGYRLPLGFRDAVKEFRLRLAVERAAAAPRILGGPIGDLRFTQQEHGYTAEAAATDAPVAGELVVSLPGLAKQPVTVEVAPDGQAYFTINDLAADPRFSTGLTGLTGLGIGSSGGRGAAAATGSGARNPVNPVNPVKDPHRLTLFWDASGSREMEDHRREFAFLRAYFARLAGHPVHVDLVLFRNEAEPPVPFTIERGNAGALIAALQRVAYDGGTQMGCLAQPAGDTRSDCCLLFSDGLTTIGKEEPATFHRPLYAFSAGTSANYAFLRALAARSGGQSFSLNRLSDAQVLAGMGEEPFCFLGATAEGAELASLYPQTRTPINGRFTLAGRLSAPQARITLRYGAGGRVLKQSQFVVARADAVPGDLLRRAWAQKKVDELLVLPERNEQEILRVGKQYGLVTPGTSLMVLERLEQYVEHDIRPPAQLKEMRDQWERIMDERAGQKKKEDAAKIDHIRDLWAARTKWWDAKHQYAEGFRYRPPKEKRTAVGSPAAGAAPAEAPATPGVVTSPTPTTPAPRPSASSNGHAAGGEGRRPGAHAADVLAQQPGEGLGSPGKSQPAGVAGAIVIKEWNPDTPYLRALKDAPADRLFDAYVEQRKTYAASPAFYLDCGAYFLKAGQDALGVQVLSNIAELDLENAPLLRVLGYKLAQDGKLNLAVSIFEQALKLRPEEPQSHRDLALVLARRAHYTHDPADFERAMKLLNHVVMNRWDRFDEIEVVALMEMNALWSEFQRRFPDQAGSTPPFDARLCKRLDLDTRIVLTWDADMTDIDLHVIEPSGEEAFYGHNRTTIGGLVSCDFTQGYGPEEYCLRKAMHGTYKIDVNYFGSNSVSLQGPVTVQVDVFTNYGRPNEQRKSLTLRLTQKKETIRVGEMEF